MAKKAHPLRVALSLRVAFALASGLVVALSVFAGAAMAQNPVPFIDQPLIPDGRRPEQSTLHCLRKSE